MLNGRYDDTHDGIAVGIVVADTVGVSVATTVGVAVTDGLRSLVGV